MNAEESLKKAQADFNKFYVHLQNEYAKLQLGRANPALLEDIQINVYGSSQPMKAVASINVNDARTLYIQPWDKSNILAIEKAISESGLGLNPMNDGIGIRIVIPALTQERRAELSKRVSQLAEEARIFVRTTRQEAHNNFKHLKSDGDLTEDDVKFYEKKLQSDVEEINKNIEDLAGKKEQDIMTV